MRSAVFNTDNAKVEQLTNVDAGDKVIFNIGELLGAIDLVSNTILIPLDPQRVYLIKRTRLRLGYFNNPDVAAAVYAFPRWEQFVAAIQVNADLADLNGNIQKNLFANLAIDLTDGITGDIIFKEPFIFTVSTSTGGFLRITFNPQASIFTALTGIIIPPVAGTVINCVGSFAMEGVSFNFEAWRIYQSGVRQGMSDGQAAGPETDNIIDIEI